MPLAPGEIYDSNRVLLQTLLIADGFEPVAWPVLPDDPVRIAGGPARCCVLLRRGDHLRRRVGRREGLPAGAPAARTRRGAFLESADAPGHAGAVRQAWASAHLLGLPGNPVSVLRDLPDPGPPLAGRPAGAQAADGRAASRALAVPIRKSHDRLEFLRGKLACDADGQLQVARIRPTARTGCARSPSRTR